jgi:hypothetical protein
MAAENAQRADDSHNQSGSFSKKRPTLLYDNGHGTKVVLWEDGISNLQIERSYPPKGATGPSQRVTEVVTFIPQLPGNSK